MVYEKDIETKVCNYAKGLGFLAIKITSPSAAGLPDRLFITNNGKMFFAEFKTQKGKLSKLQTYYIALLKQYNVDVYIIKNAKKGKRIIKKYA